MASQITRLTIVYTIDYSGADQRNDQSPVNSPVTGEFIAQMASNAENIFFDDVIMMACYLGFERWTMFYSNPLTAVAVTIRWLQSWTYFLSGFSGYWWNFGPCGWMKRVRSNNLNNLLHSKAQHVTVKHQISGPPQYMVRDLFPAGPISGTCVL